MYIGDKFCYLVLGKCYILELETYKDQYGFFNDTNFERWNNLMNHIGLPVDFESFVRTMHTYDSRIHFIEEFSFQSASDVFYFDTALDKCICEKFKDSDKDQSLLNYMCQYEERVIYLPVKYLNFAVQTYIPTATAKHIGSKIIRFEFQNSEDRNKIIDLLAYKISILEALSALPTFTSEDRKKVIAAVKRYKEKINLPNPINNTVMITDEERNAVCKGTITPSNNNIFGNMFGNMNNVFQGMNIECGVISDQSIAISPKGICFLNPDTQTYKAWDSKNKELIDMAGIAMPGMFFKIPVSRAKLKEGDVLLINGEYRIFDGWASKTMKLINPLTGVQTNKQKETNLFNITFFTKVSCMFNLFDKMGGKDKGIESFMMMQMLGGQGGMQGQDMLSTYLQFKMMSNLMGGEGDFDLGFNSLFGAFGEDDGSKEEGKAEIGLSEEEILEMAKKILESKQSKEEDKKE